jgi:Uma2 family endonuclease
MPDTLAAPAPWWPPPTAGRVTLDEFESLPEGAPFEFWAGTLVHRVTGQEFASLDAALLHLDHYGMAPASRFFHQAIVGNLFRVFDAFVHARALGRVLTAPVDVRLTVDRETHTFEPDVLFLSHARMPDLEARFVTGPPDLVAEVLSPSTAHRDLTHKRDLYAAAGVDEYWIVDPQTKAVDVFVREGAAYTLAERSGAQARSRVLDGLVVSVPDLFA